MKLKEGFITHDGEDEHIMVTAGNTGFNGMVRSNSTAGAVIELLKGDVTKEDIVACMLEKYDASEAVISRDVDMVLEKLRQIGAIDD